MVVQCSSPRFTPFGLWFHDSWSPERRPTSQDITSHVENLTEHQVDIFITYIYWLVYVYIHLKIRLEFLTEHLLMAFRCFCWACSYRPSIIVTLWIPLVNLTYVYIYIAIENHYLSGENPLLSVSMVIFHVSLQEGTWRNHCLDRRFVVRNMNYIFNILGMSSSQLKKS